MIRDWTMDDRHERRRYKADTVCTWLIAPTKVHRSPVTLKFDKFDLEDGFDFLYVCIRISAHLTLPPSVPSDCPLPATSTVCALTAHWLCPECVPAEVSMGRALTCTVKKCWIDWNRHRHGTAFGTHVYTYRHVHRRGWAQIYDGDNDKSRLIKKLTGSSLPDPITAEHGHMFIK